MNTYIELDTNSIMGEEIRKTIDVLSNMLVHHPLTEEESECLDMARFYLSRVNRAMIFQLKVRKEDDVKKEGEVTLLGLQDGRVICPVCGLVFNLLDITTVTVNGTTYDKLTYDKSCPNCGSLFNDNINYINIKKEGDEK